MKQTTQQDTEQPKRYTNKQLIKLFGMEAFLKASTERKRMQKGHPHINFILVPSMNLKMISVIGAEEFDKGQDGVGCIIHDHLHKAEL